MVAVVVVVAVVAVVIVALSSGDISKSCNNSNGSSNGINYYVSKIKNSSGKWHQQKLQWC